MRTASRRAPGAYRALPALSFCLLLVAVSWLGAAPASASETPQVFVDRLASRALQIFSQPQSTREAKSREFRSLLNDGFAMTSIAKFCLGRYWQSATPAQQQEYLRLFEDMIVNVYSARFAQYSGETYRIAGTRPEGDGDAVVVTEILNPGGAAGVKVDWRVRSSDGGNKVIDVTVEGISMLVTLRSEITSVVQRGGGDIDGLLTVLRQRATAQAN